MESRHGWKAAVARTLGVSPSYIAKVDDGSFRVGTHAMRAAHASIPWLPASFFTEPEEAPAAKILGWMSEAMTAGDAGDGGPSTPRDEAIRGEWRRLTHLAEELRALADAGRFDDLERKADGFAKAVLALSHVREAQAIVGAPRDRGQRALYLAHRMRILAAAADAAFRKPH